MDAHNPSPTHCLEMAHVLFMDIVAFSTLPMDQQESILGELQAAVSHTSEFAHAQAEDELIRLPTGDGMALVFFHDPEAPVRCALELGRSLRDHPEIKLRMGIHSGPVYRIADINANRNVTGGGINIAQRVMDCGDAGHVLVSSAEAEVLGQLSAWRPMLHDLGEVEVKHGVRVHLYNLYAEDAGNPERPNKISAQRAALSLAASGVKKKKRSLVIVVVTMILAIVSVFSWVFYTRKAHALTEKDTIVLADFTNTTGDEAFDDTLKQALAVGLGQSPFLNILSDEKTRQTLRQMTRSPDQRLTQGLAREVCQRAGSKAYLAGSIAALGTQYVIGLEALNCASGDVLAREQVTAAGKEQVLPALGQAAAKLRNEVGESVGSVQKFDVPLQQATTNSLEALKAYTVALKTKETKGDVESIPFVKRAIELDPNFALAYAGLGISYDNLGQQRLGADNLTKAFQLRDRVTEREKFLITGSYYERVTGELEKAGQTFELWIQAYPRDDLAYTNLGALCIVLGQYEKAATEIRESLRLEPNDAISYANLGTTYVALNRFDEARATMEEAQRRKLEGISLHMNLYLLAFLQGNVTAMKQQTDWAVGKPGAEDLMLSLESDTEAFSGRLRKSRELSRQAVESARLRNDRESAAFWQTNAAMREARYGNAAAASRDAAAAVALAPGSRDAKALAAMAFASAGEGAQGQSLADDLAKRSEDTLVQSVWLPTIRAQGALEHNNSSRAIEILRAAIPYELGTGAALNPVYVRGEAYLAARQGSEAAAEFQKILDHRGIVQNDPMGALAHLQIARAYMLQGDTAKARAAYQDFLALWKDADPDIPILIAAKAEYAKLK